MIMSISASMVFGFLALVFMLKFCSMSVNKANPFFESSSKYFVAQARAACLSTPSASTGTVKPLNNAYGSFVALSALVRLVSIAASTPARSIETEVVVGARCGESCNSWRGVTIRTFSHAAVNSPGATST